MDHLRHTSSFLCTNLCGIIFDETYRILELGFGNEIEKILYILGSRQDESIDKENPESYFSKYHRQNVLSSATLKEKVNHLVKINLESPIMIRLDYKKMQPMLSFKEFGSL